jgi:hypothetical protein
MPQIAVLNLRTCGWPQSLRLPLINTKESDMPASTIEFAKLVQVMENVNIDKTIDVDSFVLFNTAMANANAEALGTWTHTQTLTEAVVVQGVGSSSGSESVAAANPAFPIFPDTTIA